jgi:outer membrane protein assembly factor BamB
MVLSVPEKGKLAAFDLSQNRLLWQFPADGQQHRNSDDDVEVEAVYTTPVVSQQTVYVGGYDGYIYALDITNGAIRWEFETDGSIIGGLLVESDTVYAGSADGNVYALSAADGTTRWPPFDTGGEIWSRPTLSEGTLYITSIDGTVHAVNAQNGDREGNSFKAKAGIASPAVVAQGKVLVGSLDSSLYALDANNLSNVLWQFSADNWFWTEPFVDRNVIYAGSLDGRMYAIDLNSGNEVWNQDVGGPVRAKPILAQGVLVVATKAGEVWGLNPQTGDPTWPAAVTIADDVLADPFVMGENVYLTDTNGGLHGIRITDGSPVAVPDLKALV